MGLGFALGELGTFLEESVRERRVEGGKDYWLTMVMMMLTGFHGTVRYISYTLSWRVILAGYTTPRRRGRRLMGTAINAEGNVGFEKRKRAVA